MNTAGYSDKSLITKLGYKTGEKIYTRNAPTWFTAELKAAQLDIAPNLPADWAHIFVEWEQDLIAILADLELGSVNNGLWVSWPKKASKVPSDLTEQTLRDMILPLGWVDIKVAAIDDTWSGLKFTRRKS